MLKLLSAILSGEPACCIGWGRSGNGGSHGCFSLRGSARGMAKDELLIPTLVVLGVAPSQGRLRYLRFIAPPQPFPVKKHARQTRPITFRFETPHFPRLTLPPLALRCVLEAGESRSR